MRCMIHQFLDLQFLQTLPLGLENHLHVLVLLKRIEQRIVKVCVKACLPSSNSSIEDDMMSRLTDA
ncbi:hypothetical protein BDV98DRAFT_562124 [Pterulicium gracile]|uniref:Uncharacterized protein n=1 Tax=Pterulicium gracile TaxID=1884261 RepID=A0A5C3QR68_9AGAR|nr:hypothetical protein BDV98DRAFT_562124 [Pterula gracilis]